MSVDERLLMELANQIGLKGGASARNVRQAEQKAQHYEGRSEQELLGEIMSLRESMKANPQMYEKQIKAMRSLRSMMNGEQKARLDKLLRLLEQE